MNVSTYLKYKRTERKKEHEKSAEEGLRDTSSMSRTVSMVDPTDYRRHPQKRAQPQGQKTLTVTGASTLCTLLSSTNISRARKHNALTSPSRKYSHRFNRSICSSRQLFPPLVNDDAVMLVVSGSVIWE